MKFLESSYASIERPFAWLNLDALDANIRFVQKACGDKQIRIATKSIRSIPVLKYIAQQLDNCSGFMTFTASETTYLLEQDFDNLLIGYPVFEYQSIVNIAQHVKKGANVTFMVDDIAQVTLLQKIAKEHSIFIRVCIDLNMSTDYRLLYFGTKRSPISTIQKLDQFLSTLKKCPNIIVKGVMGYDAQIAGVADYNKDLLGIKGALIRKLKKHSLPKLTRFRQQAVAHIKHYHDIQFVNGGGSGSMDKMSTARDITEITVGSAFFAPALFDHYKSLQLKPAVGFALRVTRKFNDQFIVCHGGGYIASGAAGKDRLPVFLDTEHYELTSLEGAGEVQTPILVKNKNHQIGDTIYFRHAKAGELCERFRVLHTSRNGQYAGPIQTYRGDEQCFL